MAGLGLTAALQNYQQGSAWHDQNEEFARQKQIRDQINAANLAGSRALSEAKAAYDEEEKARIAAWTASGKSPKEYKAQEAPMESFYLKGMDERGNELAKAGLMQEWTKNFAEAAPLRERLRTRTLDKAEQEFRLDNDLGKYAKTVYGSVHDGNDIADFSKDSTGGLGFKGASAKANAGEAMPEDRYTIKFNDGRTVTKSAAEIKDLILSARDPAAMHKYEFESRLKLADALAKAKEKALEQESIGAREKDVATHKNGLDLGLTTLKEDRADKRASSNDATSIRVADIHAGASRYAADTGLEKAKREKPSDPVKDKENLLDTLAKAGIGEQDPLTKQVRPGDLTDRAAARVNQYRSDGMDLDAAVAKVKAEMRAKGLLK